MTASARASDTVARLLTPPGLGAVAAIQVCGPVARQAIESLLVHPRAGGVAITSPHRLYYRYLVDGDGTEIDDVLVCRRHDHRGLDVVDITTHGGTRVVERLLQALHRRDVGVLDATATETASAGSVVEAEALACLVAAKTRRAVRFLARQRSLLPVELLRVADLPHVRPHASVRDALRDMLEASRPAKFLLEGATIVLIGPTNAGKSTLANRLSGFEQSIVSAAPGTTRDWTAETTAIDGVPVSIVDTAGLCEDASASEKRAIDHASGVLAGADIQLVVLDGSAPLGEAKTERLLAGCDPPRLLVVQNKADMAPSAIINSPGGTPGSGELHISALTGHNLSKLIRKVLDRLGMTPAFDERPSLFSPRLQAMIRHLLAEDSMHDEDLCRRLADLTRRPDAWHCG